MPQWAATAQLGARPGMRSANRSSSFRGTDEEGTYTHLHLNRNRR
jgi:hypothetical protein